MPRAGARCGPVGFEEGGVWRWIPMCRCGAASIVGFRRTGSASATVKHFREQDLRLHRSAATAVALRVLHNPRYAGIYCFGRTRRRKLVGGAMEFRKLPREQWTVRLPDAHPGYITAEQYEANLRIA